MSPRTRRQAFTLTELLVVCAVIIILMSLLLVCVDGLYSYAMQLKCQHHLEQIWGACVMYASASQGTYPAAWTYGATGGSSGCAWNDLLTTLRYLDDKGVIGCPATELPATSGSAVVNTGTPVTDTSTAILGGLRWFKNLQQANGSWAVEGAGSCDGAAGLPSQTGFALLSFFGFGINETHSEFGDCVRRGVQFLISSSAQNKTTGSFTSSGSFGSYMDGVATMAVCEAYRLVQDPALKEQARAAAQLGVDRLRNPPLADGNAPFDGGYYVTGGCKSDSTDTSISGWCTQGVLTGYHDGLTVTQDDIDHINHWLDRCWMKPGRDTSAGSYIGATPYRRNSQAGTSWCRLTAATHALRLLNGQKSTDADVITQANWVVTNPLAGYLTLATALTNSYGGLYYGYYTTLGMFLMGDTADKKYWSDWANLYMQTLINSKTVQSSTPGQEVFYWPSNQCLYGSYTGKVYSTALACMALGLSVAQYTPGTRYYLSGQLSYGYNRKLGLNRGQPSPDTIAIMDYTHSMIDVSDPSSYVATRHGGKANVMFTDGHVKAMTAEELLTTDKKSLKLGLLTPLSGD